MAAVVPAQPVAYNLFMSELKRLPALLSHVRALAHRYRLQLILALRVTVSALSALAIAQVMHLKLPLWAVLAVHFLPVPYNIFLTIAVWRTAEKSGAKAALMLLGSALWLIATVVI